MLGTFSVGKETGQSFVAYHSGMVMWLDPFCGDFCPSIAWIWTQGE